jgi:hypothetical protein
MVATVKRRTKRIALMLVSALLAPLVWSGQAPAHDLTPPLNHSGEAETIAVGALSLWLEARFSDSELERLRPGDLAIESHYCSCYDRPKPHYPYPVVLLKTPKGDLVARPDSREGVVSFTPLAVRHGERYCDLESEHDCYGSFREPCEFTDFRYGPYLAEFFPDCTADDEEPVSVPRHDADVGP